MAQNERGGFSTEYAKTGRSTCKTCQRGIAQGDVRVGKEEKSDYHDGWDLSWHHWECVAPNKKGWGLRFNSTKDLKGVELLRWADQEELRAACGEKVTAAEAAKMKKDNAALWTMADALADAKVSTKLLQSLLDANGMFQKKRSPSVVLGKAADLLAFGRISPCPSCKTERLYYNSAEYVCRGWASAYTRCGWRGTDNVVRFRAELPKDVAAHKFFKSWKPPATAATAKYSKKAAAKAAGADDADGDDAAAASSSSSGSGSSSDDGDGGGGGADDDASDDTLSEGNELWGMRVAVAGGAKSLGGSAKELGALVEAHGGEVVAAVRDATVMVTGEADATKKRPVKKVADAKSMGVPMLTSEWLRTLCERKSKAALALRKRAEAQRYAALGADAELPATRLATRRYDREREAAAAERKRKRDEKAAAALEERKKKRKRRKPVAGSDVLKVDAASDKAGVGEIVVTHDDDWGYTPYNIMLNYTDIQTGVNKFYRAQVIKSKTSKKYWFFISYGRVGVDAIGDARIYDCGSSENAALARFVEKFEDKTGNKWDERDVFEKRPGKYYMVELDDGNEPEGSDDDSFVRERARKRQKGDGDGGAAAKAAKGGAAGGGGGGAAAAPLDAGVRELVSLIFDKKMMMGALKEMKIDVKKMPLGKISKRQLSAGYRVLSEIEAVINAEGGVNQAKLIDATNRFYTLIPHDFGTAVPPLIETGEQVREKQKMIEALVDLEIAQQLDAADGGDGDDGDDEVRQLYRKLRCELQTVASGSDEYKMCESYAHNQKEHCKYRVDAVYRVEREGEAARFAAKQALGNRLLLWHGSRLTNYVGILSQGLRIAPPEAPKSGYRFGKGIYCADLLSKSFNYCRSYGSDTALVMLLDTAAGKHYECLRDEYMEKPKKNTHSTKAMGARAPDPKATVEHEGVTVPLGKPTPTGVKSSCIHNEYIYYDVAQVRIKYLLRLKVL